MANSIFGGQRRFYKLVCFQLGGIFCRLQDAIGVGLTVAVLAKNRKDFNYLPQRWKLFQNQQILPFACRAVETVPNMHYLKMKFMWNFAKKAQHHFSVCSAEPIGSAQNVKIMLKNVMMIRFNDNVKLKLKAGTESNQNYFSISSVGKIWINSDGRIWYIQWCIFKKLASVHWVKKV